MPDMKSECRNILWRPNTQYKGESSQITLVTVINQDDGFKIIEHGGSGMKFEKIEGLYCILIVSYSTSTAFFADCKMSSDSP